MDIKPLTKQIIISIMGIVSLSVAIGWGFGTIESKDALLVIVPLFTGFFGLLKGE